MLSVAPVRSAGGAADYFAKDDYYTGEHASEVSAWGGRGAAELARAEGVAIPGEPRRQEQADLRQEHRVDEKEHDEQSEQPPSVAHAEQAARQCRLGYAMLVERL